MTVSRSRLLLALAIACGVVACNRESSPTVASLGSADAGRAAVAISQPAWLRDRLPAHTVGYARMPTIWGLLSAPSGRPLDVALASEAHTQMITQLRTAIGNDKLLGELGAKPFLMLAFDDLAGPLELAIVDAGDMANPTSSIFVTAPLRLADVAQVNARLAAIAGDTPLLKAPLAADGKGEAVDNGYLHYDAKTQRLHALFGMTASASGLQQIVDQLGTTRSHPLLATEQGMDRSGQGLFFWMSLKGINGMASAQLPSAAPGTLSRDFIDNSQSIAMGWGTVDQRGKLQIQLQAPQARFLSYFAPTEFSAALKTAGKPQWAFTMALPTAAQLANLESHLDQDFGAGSLASYRTAMDQMKQKTGVELKDLLGVVGPELIAFEDDAGAYWALRVNDRKAFQARIDEMGGKLGWKQTQLQAGKASVQHLQMPGMTPTLPGIDSEGDRPVHAWLQLYARMGNHLYWVEDGNYLVFGAVPQALADRAAATRDTDLGDWLRKTQSYDPASTLFGITATTRNIQRTMYYAYISCLQLFGDLVGAPVNVASLPAASELKLPIDGATGIALEATPDRMGLSISYEQSPLEALFAGGGMGAVAATAIVAAVALPAYKDYTIRAQVATVFKDMQPLQVAIAEYRDAHKGKLPATDDDLDLPELGEGLKYLSNYYVEDGSLVLTFGDEADSRLTDQVLVIQPIQRNGELGWRCGYAAVDDAASVLGTPEEQTTVDAKFLPGSCR